MPDQTDQTIGSDHIFCSHCGTENAGGGYSCTRCGERLIEITADAASPMGLVSCARCGGANNTRAVYCWVCGTEMNDAVRISPVPQAKPTRTASTYQPDLNPISVPAPVSEPKDDRTDLRGPAPGPGPGPGTETGPVASTDDGGGISGEWPANTSGVKDGEVPREIKRWNWAAFLMPDIWGVFNGVPWALALILIAYLPVFPLLLKVAIILPARIFLGVRGNQLAWQRKKWKSPAHFAITQRRWSNLSLIVFTIIVIVSFTVGQQAPQ